MQDETKSTSPDTPRNAFHPDFLRRRHDREDEPLAALEAESRGPWIVVESTAAVRGAGATQKNRERYEIYRSWEDSETDEPVATFHFREQAFLYAAALEVGGRRSVLTVGREPTEKGYEVIQWDIQGRPKVVGHVAVYDEDVLPAFQNLETLLRAIEPLAQVLDAAGGGDRGAAGPAVDGGVGVGGWGRAGAADGSRP